MKRWTFRIVLCLLLGALGAVTTVGVSWGLALEYDWVRNPKGDFTLGYAGPTDSEWLVSMEVYHGTVVVSRVADYETLVELAAPHFFYEPASDQFPGWSRVHEEPRETDSDVRPSDPPDTLRSQTEVAHGWPDPALWLQFDHVSLPWITAWKHSDRC